MDIDRISPDGMWVTMITPFTDEGKVDYESLKRLVEWYIEGGLDGIFAICQSSEIFFLTPEEKIKILKATIKAADGRIPIVASGHTSDNAKKQLDELKAVADTGVEDIVLIVNRFAKVDENDHIWKNNLDNLVDNLDSSVALGMYECPYPYHRFLSEDNIKHIIANERFVYFKDTCCSINKIKARLELIKGSNFKLYNANTLTVTASIQAGAHGYSGIMANFHPHLYSKLYSLIKNNDPRAEELQSILGVLSAMDEAMYPLTAKIYLKDRGILNSAFSRRFGSTSIPESYSRLLEQQKIFVDSLKW